MHANPRLGGSRYWNYSLNELGTQDIAAQVGGPPARKDAQEWP